MRFTKISIKPPKDDEAAPCVRIGYEKGDPENPDEYSAKITDEPHPDFTLAFADLAADVLDLCELPFSELIRISVRGVTFSNKQESRYVTMTALRTLEKHTSPLVLNTPAVPVDELPDETLHRLCMLEEEAGRFLDGKRAQGDLFAEETEEEEMEEALA